MKDNDMLSRFIDDQLSVWPMAERNFKALESVRTRKAFVNGLEVTIQFNPSRIISSAAKTDRKSIEKRPCFLCPEHRFHEQRNEIFEGPSGAVYDILLNPYPIFPDHLVIASSSHSPQSIWGRYEDVLMMGRMWESFTFFYNGPMCGASAPDHMHFQACRSSLMPLENDVERRLSEGSLVPVFGDGDGTIYEYDRFVNGVFVISSSSPEVSSKLFYRLLRSAMVPDGDVEPRFNMICRFCGGEYHSIIIFRRCHRSHHYFSTGDDHLTMSPGCADMGGMLIVPCQEDFDRITPEMLAGMMEEITYSEKEVDSLKSGLRAPVVSVGIMSARSVDFSLLPYPRSMSVSVKDGKLEFCGKLYDELVFDAIPGFILERVVIGKGFHWERTETQTFKGGLRFIVEDGLVCAVNLIGMEEYLKSVVSSEMRATASLEFLKSHAVISRSWIMSRLARRMSCAVSSSVRESSGEIHVLRWYGQGDHRNYDVCADDHCQRYQGVGRIVCGNASEAVDSTAGQVLLFKDRLCDARFSKCCGGVSEEFSSCWEDRSYPYLKALPDTPGHVYGGRVFCDTDDRKILGQVLNDFDMDTGDFFRWHVIYGRDELSELVERRSGYGVGRISSLVPMSTGASGRIVSLKIQGDKGVLVVGKELEIRRILSESHLKSSAFRVSYLDAGGNETDSSDWVSVRLDGKGWGHGVGLCQIGAAVMAENGYDYRQILEHYYPGSKIRSDYGK